MRKQFLHVLNVFFFLGLISSETTNIFLSYWYVAFILVRKGILFCNASVGQPAH